VAPGFAAIDALRDEAAKPIRGGVVVTNPGSTPEIGPAASALAERGLLGRYYAPIATTPAHELALRRWLPTRVRGPILNELRRRPIPAHVPADSVRRVGSAANLATVAMGRVSKRRLRGVHDAYMSLFDARASRGLRPGDEAVLAVAGAARRTLGSAQRLEAVGFLDCPLAHHRFLDAFLKEEAKLVPDYAPTLQEHDRSQRKLDWLDEELRRAHRLIVLSSFERSTFCDRGVDEEKMVICPLGVDLDLFRPQQRPVDDIFRIVFVGQITQRKGLSYLIEAFRRASIPKSELVLVGRPVGSIDPWARIPGVKHVPFMPRRQLPAVYANADVYVLPSLVEGFGLTALEAMASGLPVVLSEHTFGSDVITDGVEGFVVPIRDPESIVERLRLLAADPDRRREMGRAARFRAGQYSWEEAGRRFADGIERVLRDAT
jgi:starch synthase